MATRRKRTNPTAAMDPSPSLDSEQDNFYPLENATPEDKESLLDTCDTGSIPVSETETLVEPTETFSVEPEETEPPEFFIVEEEKRHTENLDSREFPVKVKEEIKVPPIKVAEKAKKTRPPAIAKRVKPRNIPRFS